MSLNDDAWAALPALIVGFILAGAITLVATPIVRRYARRMGIVDRPEARRVNKRVMARGGGIAILLGFVPVSLLLVAINAVPEWHFVDAPPAVGPPQVAALIGGAVLAAGLGLLDDIYQLRARWQFLGQFLLAGFAVAMGVVVASVNFPFAKDGVLTLAGAVAAVATFLWIVGLVNSINFIDGLDGLSSGIALIALVTLGVISLTGAPDEPYIAIFCFVLAGALAGFLRWNFHPATIFAGTSGIMLVGYSLAVLSVLGAAKIAVALLVLGVPIIDTFWIIVRRLVSGNSPFAPDRGHIHHRLLDLGLSHRNTVLVIYGICAALAVLSLGLSAIGQMYAFLGLGLVFGVVLFLITKLGGNDKVVGEDLDRHAYDNPDDETPPSDPAPTVQSAPPEVAAPPEAARSEAKPGPREGSEGRIGLAAVAVRSDSATNHGTGSRVR
jgi:UDP-GlcNAc:undecaprenyl-phosphate/decaprenyl-phosphate GlcNAc-1-phosphate transferase